MCSSTTLAIWLQIVLLLATIQIVSTGTYCVDALVLYSCTYGCCSGNCCSAPFYRTRAFYIPVGVVIPLILIWVCAKICCCVWERRTVVTQRLAAPTTPMQVYVIDAEAPEHRNWTTLSPPPPQSHNTAKKFSGSPSISPPLPPPEKICSRTNYPSTSHTGPVS
ncbi:unnamed protein product [Candidula unifasciata]|uniref:Transmembrane protein 92 n=1 Tax=Candidula unifasciata TaxID=100452 RepID=A0A8S3ZL04_9EUPU|nr:unnamed protein product [Candidula unifasciata]